MVENAGFEWKTRGHTAYAVQMTISGLDNQSKFQMNVVPCSTMNTNGGTEN